MLDADALRVVGRRLLIAVVTLDAVLILANAVDPLALLDLDQEGNVPTWYSSLKLALAALAAGLCGAFQPAEQRRGPGRWTWSAVAGLLLLLSLDETATLHERLAAALMTGDLGSALRQRVLGGDATKDAFIWPVLFAPVIAACLFFLLGTLYLRLRGNRRSLWLGLAGCAALATAVLLEGAAVYTSPPIEAWGDAEIARYRFFTLLEEALEIGGATLLLASLVTHAVVSAGVRSARPS